jgi:hypothetical protein
LLALGVDLKIILECHPVTWTTSPDYQTMVTKINSLTVINESAERDIALICDSIQRGRRSMNGIVIGFGSPKDAKQENADFTALTLIVR